MKFWNVIGLMKYPVSIFKVSKISNGTREWAYVEYLEKLKQINVLKQIIKRFYE